MEQWANNGLLQNTIEVNGDAVDVYEIIYNHTNDEDYDIVGYAFSENDANLVAAAPELLSLAKQLSSNPYCTTPDQWQSEAYQILKKYKIER